MYRAVKGDLRCRIPESKVKTYEAMGYTCTKISEGNKKDAKKLKGTKTEPLAKETN